MNTNTHTNTNTNESIPMCRWTQELDAAILTNLIGFVFDVDYSEDLRKEYLYRTMGIVQSAMWLDIITPYEYLKITNMLQKYEMRELQNGL